MIHVFEPLVPPPLSGRTFSSHRKIRLGDVCPEGSLRLDALIRYAQDVSNDDTADADLADDLAWVVRRTVVDVLADAELGETLTFTTFCSGIGGRWAERRLRVRGDRGGHYEIATLWVHLDAESNRPKRLSDQFLDLYGEASRGRRVSARLVHDPPPDEAERRSWPLRFVDFDVFGHVNNAAYWAVVEEHMAERSLRRCGRRIELEYGAGIGFDDAVGISPDAPGLQRRAVTLAIEYSALDGFAMWWLGATGSVAASAILEPLLDVYPSTVVLPTTPDVAGDLNSEVR